ncbi:hypothetical protein CRG98_023151 [Punica granatum]|uniref:Uncharacterized protein n=1 Tax=Punica granatum TaxID=22663 RepID=A0A2I0JKM8_PUNGR|nr:hypothetical protein CRG98_023151 [Punica granatum]
MNGLCSQHVSSWRGEDHRRGPYRDIYHRVHVWASTSPLPRHLRGSVHTSELLIASQSLGVGLGELPLWLWLAGEFLILWRIGEVLVSRWGIALPRDGGPRLKGVNSSKSGGILFKA